MVDDLPKNFSTTGYVEITDGKNLVIHNIIPPDGNDLKRSVELWEIEGPDKDIYINDTISCKPFNVENLVYTDEIKIDMSDLIKVIKES